jgi:predicted TIM-barrel fold metal-dependent hydrolase
MFIEGVIKMLIDFHTHCFPENLAEKAMGKLRKICGFNGFTDGIAAENIEFMKKRGVDKAVVCNIATNPHQQKNVNDFAIHLNDTYNELISFGSVHPDSDYESIKYDLTRIKEAGLKGIKLHPDYVNHFITDDAFTPVFKLCCELDLIVLTHAGFDYLTPKLYHCLPEGLLKVRKDFPSMKFVAAHFGGARCWDDVEKFLIGTDIWFDLSVVESEHLDKKQAQRMFDAHDPNKILFATDLPWNDARDQIDYIESLDLTNEVKEKIYYKNALQLLGMIK